MFILTHKTITIIIKRAFLKSDLLLFLPTSVASTSSSRVSRQACGQSLVPYRTTPLFP